MLGAISAIVVPLTGAALRGWANLSINSLLIRELYTIPKTVADEEKEYDKNHMIGANMLN